MPRHQPGRRRRECGAALFRYAVNILPGELIHVHGGAKLRVLDLVPVSEADSPFDGLLMVEPVDARPRD